MVKRRKMDEQELMKVTEELLIDRGYEKFHFKILSEKLGIGRTTIYDYFTNKEELIVTYAEKLIREILEECETLSQQQSSRVKMEALFQILMKYTHIPLVIQILLAIDRKQSKRMAELFINFDVQRNKLRHIFLELIEEGKQNGEIRRDVSNELVEQLIFQIIQIPQQIPSDSGMKGSLLFDIVFNGIGEKKS